MNSDWQLFLSQHGATIEAGVVQSFTDTASELLAAQNNTTLCDLSQFGVLRASGEEAQSFLQNLLSNDIREVNATHAQRSSFNTAKGRMLAAFLIWRDGDDYLLQLPNVLTELMRKKLSMYVLRAKVKISDASNEIVSLGVSGANAQKVLGAELGELPQASLDLVRLEQASIIKISDTRYQVNTTIQHAAALWQKLSQQLQPVGSVCWNWLDIRSGIPVILPQTQEQFVPQMVNLELIDGVNFKKGCYPGQEIVARMQYLGKTKRRMYLVHLDSSEAPLPGDELFSPDMEDQVGGMIANVSPAPGGGYDALAVMQISSHEGQQVHWKSPQGETLQFLQLPYSIPL